MRLQRLTSLLTSPAQLLVTAPYDGMLSYVSCPEHQDLRPKREGARDLALTDWYMHVLDSKSSHKSTISNMFF